MSLAPGTRLGPYEVSAPIGSGGMGEVYRARDTRLGRDVALKILPDGFASDPDRLARFEREAKTLASLNHPNIAQIYGVEESADVRAIVMELVDGRTLEEVIAAGVDTETALAIARQIADALEAAHELGIIHRDLKPANVKLRADGVAKVLDFGLAKAMAGDAELKLGATYDAATPPSVSTALSPAMTGIGVILGTAAYMSPEQARGRAVDKRADIWAFGVILYELLTGRQAYQGETVSDTIAAVLTREIDLSVLPAAASPSVRTLLARCLERDPKRRLRDIGEARLMLEPSARTTPAAANVPTTRSWRTAAVWLAAIVVSSGAAWWVGRSTMPITGGDAAVVKAHVGLDAGAAEVRGARISPDGRSMVFSAGGRLRVQRLDEWTPRDLISLAETTAAIWSPSSDAIAFTQNGRLMKVPAIGGAPVPVCALPKAEKPAAVTGAAWRPDGTIFFSVESGPIYRVSAAGGQPTLAFELPPESRDFHVPLVLPGRNELLAILHRESGSDALVVVSDSGTRVVYETPGNSFGDVVYSPSGHLLFARSEDSAIWGIRFSVADLSVEGEPFLIATGRTPSVAEDGTLAYAGARVLRERQLTWMTRDGRREPTVIPAQTWQSGLDVSPDGRSVVASTATGLWVYDLATGSRRRLTQGQDDRDPVWVSTDTVAFTRNGSSPSVVIVPASGTGTERTIAAAGRGPSAPAKGQLLVFNVREEQVWKPVWVDLSSPERVHDLGAAHRHGRFPRISPDGSLLLYVSGETGRDEIWVTRFPSGEGKWQVSTTGAGFATWSPKGDEILFRAQGAELSFTLASVRVIRGSAPAFAAPASLFKWDESWDPWYAVSADASRMLVSAADRADVPSVRIVRNWVREFAGK